MKRALALLAALAVPSLASAQDPPPSAAPPPATRSVADKTGVLGLGAEGTLGGTVGAHLRYYASPSFGLQATLLTSFETLTQETALSDVGTSVFSLGLALGAAIKIIPWDDGHVSVVGTLEIRTSSRTVADLDVSTTGFGLSFGFQGEWFPERFLSLHVQTGFGLSYEGGDTPTKFAFHMGGDAFAGCGLTFWLE